MFIIGVRLLVLSLFILLIKCLWIVVEVLGVVELLNFIISFGVLDGELLYVCVLWYDIKLLRINVILLFDCYFEWLIICLIMLFMLGVW